MAGMRSGSGHPRSSGGGGGRPLKTLPAARLIFLKTIFRHATFLPGSLQVAKATGGTQRVSPWSSKLALRVSESQGCGEGLFSLKTQAWHVALLLFELLESFYVETSNIRGRYHIVLSYRSRSDEEWLRSTGLNNGLLRPSISTPTPRHRQRLGSWEPTRTSCFPSQGV